MEGQYSEQVNEASEALTGLLAEVESGVLKLIKETSKAPSNAHDAWMAFYHAVGTNEC